MGFRNGIRVSPALGGCCDPESIPADFLPIRVTFAFPVRVCRSMIVRGGLDRGWFDAARLRALCLRSRTGVDVPSVAASRLRFCPDLGVVRFARERFKFTERAEE